jgi:hypothetical protein
MNKIFLSKDRILRSSKSEITNLLKSDSIITMDAWSSSFLRNLSDIHKYDDYAHDFLLDRSIGIAKLLKKSNILINLLHYQSTLDKYLILAVDLARIVVGEPSSEYIKEVEAMIQVGSISHDIGSIDIKNLQCKIIDDINMDIYRNRRSKIETIK